MRDDATAERIRSLLAELGRYSHAARLEVFDTAYESQALAKLQRAFDQDMEDVGAMLARGLTSKAAISAAFDQMRSDLFRFPAVDQVRLARAVTSLRV